LSVLLKVCWLLKMQYQSSNFEFKKKTDKIKIQKIKKGKV